MKLIQYKITKQFAKEKETPLAEFISLRDSELFIAAKSSDDESKSSKIIYRIYDHEKLLREYNKEKINIQIGRAQYAQGDLDLPHYFAEPFRVLSNRLYDASAVIAKFNTIDDAKIFIETKFAENKPDARTYYIFNDKQLIEQMDKSHIDLNKSQSQGGQGKENKQVFRPTPFNVAPRLGPSKWLVDEKDDDENQK